MPEEEQEQKKPGIVRRIFKWIGLGLLSILLIAALIFQAPWKVITLLVIILLACTVLPKQMRKWFWLSAGAIVVALIIWVFLPDTGDWKPYTFDEELAALEAKYAIPDSENAATIYNKLLGDEDEDEEEDENEPNFPYDYRFEPWSSEEHPKIAQWLQQQENIIQTLFEASRKKRCRFPIPTDSVSLGQSMERLAPMRRWAYLLLIAGNNDIAENRIDKAIQKYITVLQMAKHLNQQPTLIDMLVGSAIESLAIAQFKRFAVTGDATEAARLINLFDRYSPEKAVVIPAAALDHM